MSSSVSRKRPYSSQQKPLEEEKDTPKGVQEWNKKVAELFDTCVQRAQTNPSSSSGSSQNPLCLVRSLKFTGKSLEKLPTNIGRFTKLEELDLSDNNLTSLPNEIGSLKNLNKLILSKNKFTTIPIEILNLKKLKVLNIYDNFLTSIPKEIVRLAELTQLEISANELTSIPKEIAYLKKLDTLGLSANKLSTVPIELLGLFDRGRATFRIYHYVQRTDESKTAPSSSSKK